MNRRMFLAGGVRKQIPVKLDRAHGLAFVREKGRASIWCMHSTDPNNNPSSGLICRIDL